MRKFLGNLSLLVVIPIMFSFAIEIFDEPALAIVGACGGLAGARTLWILSRRTPSDGQRTRFCDWGGAAGAVFAFIVLFEYAWLQAGTTSTGVLIFFSLPFMFIAIFPVGFWAGWGIARMFGNSTRQRILAIGMTSILLGLPLYYDWDFHRERAIPDRKTNRRVQFGEGVMDSKLLFSDSFHFGRVKKIQIGPFGSEGSTRLAVIGAYGAGIYQIGTFECESRILFNPPLSGDHLISDGPFGRRNFLMSGGGFQDVGLIGGTGKLLWTFRAPGWNHPSDGMAVGDPDGRGERRYFVGTSQGLFVLNGHGKVLKRMAIGSVSTVCRVSNPMGKGFVIACGVGYSDAAKLFTLNEDGGIVSQVSAPGMDTLLESDWPERGCLLMEGSSKIINLSGHIVFRPRTPFPLFNRSATCAVADLRGNGSRYFALMIHASSGIPQSQLSVFSPDGTCVYQEIVRKTGGLVALRRPGGSRDLLVIPDEKGGFWEYSLTHGL